MLRKMIYTLAALLPTFTFASYADRCQNNEIFNIGTGIYDITGPLAEEGMMGYGMIKQQTAGLYQRLWARAFIVESPCNQKRMVIVNADLGQIFQGIKMGVVKKLKEKYGDLYSDDNVLLSATHTHSGPGGYSTYAFYNLTTLGFSRTNFDTIIAGIVNAITLAHEHMQAGRIKVAKGTLTRISYNRSPSAYLLNPKAERDAYNSDVDTEMTLLRFDDLSGHPIGMINWFPLHGVSMNNKNRLVNGDNKGYAEYLFEQDFHSNYDSQAFVAAFAQANAGDVSPNPYGHEGGSGLEGIKAVEDAGRAQYELAKRLFAKADKVIIGGVDYRHTYLEMDKQTVKTGLSPNEIPTTCPAALGISMFAGTQDGEGVGEQGITCEMITNKIPQVICENTRTPCQGVKPIALSTGTMKPYPWTPNVLPLQLAKIGDVMIAAAPFELTTMTGRRVIKAIRASLDDAEHYTITLSTLANAYAGYVATKEEYQLQRYEGASTHFGPLTSTVLQEKFAELTKALTHDLPVDKGVTPIDLSAHQLNFRPGVVFDSVPNAFGEVYKQPKANYQPGDTAQVVFWGAHPKNNYRIQDTFLAIQQFKNGQWITIKRDRDWETAYHWERSGLSYSLVTINWRIGKDVQGGLYRIAHYGDAKALFTQKITPYEGYSMPFVVG